VLDFASIERPTQASFRNANEIIGLILLFYAFSREIAPFKRRQVKRTPLALDGLHGFRAEIGGKEFAVVGHGIGHRRATETARGAFDSIPGAELVIGTGVVGALSSGLKPGDLVLSDRIMTIDGDGQVAERVIAVNDSHLRAVGRSLTSAGVAYSTGAILTSHRVLATGAEKRRAKESTGAIAVDMETAAIAAEAAARGLPFVAIRAVLDEVDDDVVGAEMADADGNVRPLAATSYLIRNPATMLRLPRMIRNLSRATAAIADALTAIAYEGPTPGARKRDRDSVARKRPR
jgi:adenosylhomocysteine nucleosidase